MSNEPMTTAQFAERLMQQILLAQRQAAAEAMREACLSAVIDKATYREMYGFMLSQEQAVMVIKAINIEEVISK